MVKLQLYLLQLAHPLINLKTFEKRGNYFNKLVLKKDKEMNFRNFWTSIDKINFILILILGLLGVLIILFRKSKFFNNK